MASMAENDKRMNNFLKYLQKNKQLESIQYISADGMPNMKYRENRLAYEKYLLDSIPTYECSICLEEKDDHACKLKCGHVFCVDCFAGLVRSSNRCALCRSDITNEPIKKKEPEQDIIIDIVQTEIEYRNEDRNNLNMVDYIYHMITNHNNEDAHAVANTIVYEIYESLHTVAMIAMETVYEET
jgi:hypothetical protein